MASFKSTGTGATRNQLLNFLADVVDRVGVMKVQVPAHAIDFLNEVVLFQEIIVGSGRDGKTVRYGKSGPG